MPPETSVGTIIPVPESTMRLTAVCPNCGATFYGFGSSRAITEVCELHDRECADLKQAGQLIRTAGGVA